MSYSKTTANRNTVVDFRPRAYAPARVSGNTTDELHVCVDLIGLDQEIETLVERRERARSLLYYLFWLSVGFLLGWLFGSL